ncbi:PTS IIA-like nitrogen regulatory protein PtsN [uncultured Lamprocystis sp.]|jgi:PTS system nitrogen regulatory IIA component|uniref:PTS IIA-like nitrogen regulatory protein PtsN n=1 Tax=uncultured Lamprocystis sp. TaxID=543132 RepID=UPI0025FE5B86|nr:PTS IIA-like nitrogen regulatory protein PtsN [uncultured Lamprocystis sp.]
MFRPDFITEQRLGCRLAIASKKRLLETLASLLAADHPRLDADLVFDCLLERERLGSTGLGHGIALPHARVKEVTQSIGAFVSLSQGVDYDAVDGEPVDLAFALLVPEAATDEHLQLLAQLAGRFNDPQVRKRLREADSPSAILRVFSGHQPSTGADP